MRKRNLYGVRKTPGGIGRSLLAAVLVVLVVGGLAGCRKKAAAGAAGVQERVVNVGYLPITHALAVFQAKEILDSRPDGTVRVQLHKFSGWNDLMDALNSGRIDGASVLVELAMGAVSRGIDLKAVALGHKDGNVVVVGNHIGSVADLRGKTFAIPSTQSSHNILLRDMLRSGGVDIAEVTVVQLAPAEMPSSLASGAIDGYCVAEPFGAQAVVQGYGKVLFDSTELWPNSVCCALVFNGGYLSANEETVGQVLEAYREAEALLESREAMAGLAAAYLGQKQETLDASLQWIHFDGLGLTRAEYQELARKVQEYGINENPPAYEAFVYQKY